MRRSRGFAWRQDLRGANGRCSSTPAARRPAHRTHPPAADSARTSCGLHPAAVLKGQAHLMTVIAGAVDATFTAFGIRPRAASRDLTTYRYDLTPEQGDLRDRIKDQGPNGAASEKCHPGRLLPGPAPRRYPLSKHLWSFANGRTPGSLARNEAWHVWRGRCGSYFRTGMLTPRQAPPSSCLPARHAPIG